MDDSELIRLVVDSDEFKNADSVNEVSRIVRRKLRKRLIDLHIDDSTDISVREWMVRRHLEYITLKILNDVDGIVMLPSHIEEIEELESAWKRARADEREKR